MEKKILLTLSILSVSVLSLAMPGYPFPVKIGIAENDSVSIIMQGDEFQKYAVTADSKYSVMCDDKGQWRYLERSADGDVRLSDYKLTSRPNKMTSDFLSRTPQRLIPKKNSTIISRKPVFRNSDNAVIGSRRTLIILAQFTDLKFKQEVESFNCLFNEQGYDKYGATGSVTDFFREISEGQLEMKSIVIGPFTTSRQMKYYGRNSSAGGGDSNPGMLFSEALSFAEKTVDLKEFDCNGDGYVDNIHIIYAGYGEEAGGSSDAIWAHESTFMPLTIKPGLYVDRYSCSPELRGNRGSVITTIGPVCHEICHALGAMDFYDTDYEVNGLYNGTGVWDVMASGSWNNEGNTPAWPNPYVRAYDFHWTEPIGIEEDGNYVINSNSPRKIYRINTTDNNDFFLLDFHNKQSFMSAEPSAGLMIFHVGPDIETRAETNTINSTFPQQCYPVCASSAYPCPTKKDVYSYGDVNSQECPFLGTGENDTFDQASVPGAFTIKGQDAGFAIRQIRRTEDDGISFIFNKVKNETTATIWKESFETDRDLRNWTVHYVNGHIPWVRESAFDGVPDGKSFVVLKPQDGVINPREISTKIVSHPFKISPEFTTNTPIHLALPRWKFSLWSKNSYRIASEFEMSLLGNGEVIFTKVFTIPTSDEWNLYSYEIEAPLSEYNDLCVSILAKAEINKGGILWLDSLSLSQVNSQEDASVDIVCSSNQRIWKIYTITGLYICEVSLPCEELPSTSNLSVQSGLYICVCESDVVKILKQ